MQAIYTARRQKLLENKPENTMVVIFSGRAPMKSLDESYPFAVDRNFFYLTGIERENMILVLRKELAARRCTSSRMTKCWPNG